MSTKEQWLPKHATALLNQQIWCWGRDIVRPESNWLLEVGFKRIEPPADRTNCPSIYKLEPATGRCVLLRGFGVFYGDVAHGGISLPRYNFLPRYTKHSELDPPPWTKADLPKMKRVGKPWLQACTSLVLGLLDWIRRYEIHILEQLGAEYRRSTIFSWDNGKRSVVPAENMASAWHELSLHVASNYRKFHGNLKLT
ncbi:MAG: hypothetical protein AAF333_08905 [Planctomycetota bacterium]